MDSAPAPGSGLGGGTGVGGAGDGLGVVAGVGTGIAGTGVGVGGTGARRGLMAPKRLPRRTEATTTSTDLHAALHSEEEVTPPLVLKEFWGGLCVSVLLIVATVGLFGTLYNAVKPGWEPVKNQPTLVQVLFVFVVFVAQQAGMVA
jgi:ABC-type amino acid transport system permease subunit